MMKARLFVWVAVFSLAALAQPRTAHAAQFFVDDLSGSCSESLGTGSQSNPWHSLHYALKQLRCGDVLNLRRGTYRLNASGFAVDSCGGSAGNGKRASGYMTQQCTAANKIVIQPYQGETVIVDGTSMQIDDSSPTSHWTRCSDGGDGPGGNNDSCGACTNLNLQNPSRTYYSEAWNFGSGDREQMWIDPQCDDADANCTDPGDTGTRLKAVTGTCASLNTLVGSCDNRWTSPTCGSFNTTALNNAIVARLPDNAGNADPDAHTVKISCQGGTCTSYGMLFDGARNIEIRGGGTMYFKYYYYGMRFDSRSADIIVDGVTIAAIGGRDYGNAIRPGSGDRITVRNSTIDEVAAECIAFYGGGNTSCNQISGNVAENNTISNCGFAHSSNGIGSSLDDGVLIKSCKNCVARNNRIFGTGRTGVKIRSDKNGGGKCSSDGAVVEGNDISDVCTSVNSPQSDCAGVHAVTVPIDFGTVQNIRISNNMIHDITGRNAAVPHGIKIDGGVRNVTITNNSINNVDAECLDTNENSVGTGNFVVRNNVFANCNTQNIGGVGLVRLDRAGDWLHSNNAYWASSSSAPAVKIRTPTAEYTRANVVPNFDPNGVSSNPLFLSSSDLHLQPASGLIDMGTQQDAPRFAIDGNLRPQGAATDIGADEFGGLATPVLISVQPLP